jgi:hypothetical protein
MTAAPEQQLLAALSQAFGRNCFDTTSVKLRAQNADDLAKALENAIPNCRYRSGYQRGRFKDRPVRRALKQLAAQHFDTDHAGWWYLKQES